jgi:hypothetical protein
MLGLKLDKYKGPINKIKRKKLSIIESENSSPEVFPDMAERNKQPWNEHHEERQGDGRDVARNQGNLEFENQRRVRDSPLNFIGEKNDLPVLPKGTLKEFPRDRAINAKRHLHLFIDVCDFHRVEHDNVMVRLFMQTLSRRSYE